MACFPFFDSSGAPRGALGLYTDRADYFDRVGLEPFVGFAQLCAVCLEQAELHGRLERLAHFDELTDLFNRSSMRAVLSREHANALRRREPYALVLFDIDRFKVINDNYGHAIGDRVLIEVTRRVQEALRPGDWLARWGAEEFLALLAGADLKEAAALTERLRLHIKVEPIEMEALRFSVTISAGIACYPGQGEELQTLLNTVDAGLFEAKRAGRDRVHGGPGEGGGIFSLAGEIEDALLEGRLTMAVQPIVELSTGKVIAEQSLARIVTRKGQVLVAEQFMDAASQVHLAHRIDFRMFELACERCLALYNTSNRRFQFINMSADLLRHPDLMSQLVDKARQVIERIVAKTGANPLVLEITEREFIDTKEAYRILAPLLDRGVRIAVDDFGSGYSSFQYLSDLPVSYLKIEGSLVRRARHNAKLVAIVEGIRDISNELQLTSLAEWVEEERTAALLRRIGIHWGQGYHFGAPTMIALS